MEKDTIVNNKILIIGGSAGSLEVLIEVFPKLHVIDNLAIVLILHRRSTEDTMLEDLIKMKTDIPVKQIEDKIRLQPGHVYVAPGDYHLLFEKNGLLSLDISEKVHFSRPSIDVSFESAADVYGKHLTGLLLSGANADGTKGLLAIKEAGGVIAVQKPETAEVSYMPHHALVEAKPDYVLDVSEMADFIKSI